MRLLVDECFPKRLVIVLRTSGHDVVWASEVCRSAPDDEVLVLATADDRIVVTEDRDYGTLVLRDGHKTIGIIIVHSSEFTGGILHCMDLVCSRISELGDRLLGQLTTIEPNRVRQRRLPDNT